MFISLFIAFTQSTTLLFNESDVYQSGVATRRDTLTFTFKSQKQVIFFASNVKSWTSYFPNTRNAKYESPASFFDDGKVASVFITQNFSLKILSTMDSYSYSFWIVEPSLCGTESAFMSSRDSIQYNLANTFPVQRCIFAPGFGEGAFTKIYYAQKEDVKNIFLFSPNKKIEYYSKLSTEIHEPFFIGITTPLPFEPDLILTKINITSNIWDGCYMSFFGTNIEYTNPDTGYQYVDKRNNTSPIDYKCGYDVKTYELPKQKMKGWVVAAIIIGIFVVLLGSFLGILLYRKKKSDEIFMAANISPDDLEAI